MSNFQSPEVLMRTHADNEMAVVEAAHSKWLNGGAAVVKSGADVTVSELLAAAKQDFTVQRCPLVGHVTLEDQSIQPLELEHVYGALKTYADGTRELIPGVSVGKKYHFVQNAATFAVIEALREAGHVKLQASGGLRGGALTWLFSSLGAREITRLDGTVDPIEYHLLSVNSFDGSTRVVHGLAPRNMRCDNALMGTLEGLQMKFSFSHTSSAAKAVEIAAAALPRLIEAQGSIHEVFQQLAQKKMGVKQFRTFAEKWLEEEYGTLKKPVDDSDQEIIDAYAQKLADRQAEADALVKYFKEGIGNSGVSAYDGYQSVTEFLDHHQDRYRKAARTAKHLQNDLGSNLFGADARAKTRALRMLVAR